MTSATAWDLGTAGFEYLSNSTNVTIVEPAVYAWQMSGNGLAGIIAFSSIILLPMIIVYLRTKNHFSSSLVGLLMTLVIHYYGLLDYTVPGAEPWHAEAIFKWIYLIVVGFLALGIYQIFMKD